TRSAAYLKYVSTGSAESCYLQAVRAECRSALVRGMGRLMSGHRIYSVSVASVYPLYVAKAVKKGRKKDEVDQIFRWLTGHSQESLDQELAAETSFEQFFARAPQMNPSRALITGVVCGVRVESIEESVMREIRYLDKLVDELAKGKAMEKILRK